MNKTIKVFGIKVYESRSEIAAGTGLDPSERLINALGGSVTEAGVPVDHKAALTLSAVWRAVNIISSTIAALPAKVYKHHSDGSRLQDDSHPVQNLLKNPSVISSDFIWRETTQALLLLYGNSYNIINRDGNGVATSFTAIHPDDVTPFYNSKLNRVTYRVNSTNINADVLADNMLHIPGLGFDGLKGYSNISVMRESLSLGIAAQKFGARFFGNGANMDGVLETPGVLTDDVYKRIRESWDEKYRGLSKSHNTAILEGGMKYTRIGIPPEDAQFLQTRQFQISEIARWFGVQPHLLMDLDRATNNNIEHQSMEFVTYTLQPWLKRWESEMNRKLFRKDEGAYVEFNLNGLLRGDSKSRGEFYRSMFSIGAISPNQIRRLENQTPYDGGDQFFAQAGFMPITDLQDFHKSKTKKNEN